MRIPIELETNDMRLPVAIAGENNAVKSGVFVDAPGNVRVAYGGGSGNRGLDIPDVLRFIVDASVTIDLSLFSTWLYDKLRDRPITRVKIGRKTVTEITEEGIRETLEEEIEIEK